MTRVARGPVPALPKGWKRRFRNKPFPVAQIVYHTFAVRTVYRDNIPTRVIMLGTGNDPTALPDWRKAWDYSILYPNIFGREVHFRRREQPDGPVYPIRLVRPSYFEMRRDSTIGMPLMGCDDEGGGITVWPEPSDEWEIVPTTEDRRTYSFEPPRPRPVNFFHGRSALGNLASGIVRQTTLNGGEAPVGVRASPDTYAALQRQFIDVGSRAFADARGLTVMGIPVVSDPFVPPGQAFIIGADPAHDRGAVAVARIEAGQITAINVTNAGAGYTAPPDLVFGQRRAFVPRVFADLYSTGVIIDPETAQRSRERARGLLKSLLTTQQWAEFEAVGAVTEHIDGCEFKLRPCHMIEATKPRLIGKVRERWCVTPQPYTVGEDWMPEEDKLIGQLLHLRAGPDKLRAAANIFPA